MENNIVKIENNDLYVGTWDLSKGFEMEHRAIKRLINKYTSEFEELGPIIFHTFQPISDDICYNAVATNKAKNRGREVEEFRLNQEQYVYLGTLLTNSDKARRFKLGLTKEFFRMRKVLIKLAIQKENQGWIEKRESGKKERLNETDEIKRFKEYAKNQGSKSAEKYYMIFTKLTYDSLLGEKRKTFSKDNIRDQIDLFDLSVIQMGETIVSKGLDEFMRVGKFYKEAFPFCKEKLESFASVIGRTPLRLLNTKEVQ